MFQRRHHYSTAVKPRWSSFNTRCSGVCVWRIYRYCPRSEQGVFQVPRWHHLCINCTELGQGRNLVAPLPLVSWAKKVRLLLKFYFPIS
jgi:uncharacterized membrane protein YhdT